MAKKGMKSKTHRVVLELSFDRPCSVTHAVAQAKDCIHGQFYPTAFENSDPEVFTIKAVKRVASVRSQGSKAA
jgi:hypothetical protein